MRKTIILAMFVSAVLCCFSGNNNENETAYKKAFKTMFLDATKVTWTTQNGYNVVNFKNGGDDNSNMLPTVLPQSVIDFINTQYSGATIVDRDNEDGMIEVDILYNGIIKELTFSNAGVWMETVTEFKDNQIPEIVTQAIAASEYATYKYEDIELIENPQESYYEVEMKKANTEVTLKTKNDGTITVLEIDKD